MRLPFYRGDTAPLHVGCDMAHAPFCTDAGAPRLERWTPGVRIGGVLQVPRSAAGCGPDAPLTLRDLESGKQMVLCARIAVEECELDPARCAPRARASAPPPTLEPNASGVWGV